MADPVIPDGLPPSWSTDPTPRNREREIDGLLRAAANLALAVISPPAVAEEVRGHLWTVYNTDSAKLSRGLARAILAARPSRTRS